MARPHETRTTSNLKNPLQWRQDQPRNSITVVWAMNTTNFCTNLPQHQCGRPQNIEAYPCPTFVSQIHESHWHIKALWLIVPIKTTFFPLWKAATVLALKVPPSLEYISVLFVNFPSLALMRRICNTTKSTWNRDSERVDPCLKIQFYENRPPLGVTFAKAQLFHAYRRYPWVLLPGLAL